MCNRLSVLGLIGALALVAVTASACNKRGNPMGASEPVLGTIAILELRPADTEIRVLVDVTGPETEYASVYVLYNGSTSVKSHSETVADWKSSKSYSAPRWEQHGVAHLFAGRLPWNGSGSARDARGYLDSKDF
jgi:hypothetical protein